MSMLAPLILGNGLTAYIPQKVTPEIRRRVEEPGPSQHRLRAERARPTTRFSG